MKIEHANRPIHEVEADWLVVGVWEGNTPALEGELGKHIGGRVAELVQRGDFEAKSCDLLSLYEQFPVAAKRVMLVGLGKKDECKAAVVSRAAGTALRAISRKKYDRVAMSLLGEGSSLDSAERACAIVTGALIGESGQDLYRTKKNRTPPQSMVLAPWDDTHAIERGAILGNSVNWAAQLVNSPPNDIYPESFCQQVKEAALPHGLTVDVLDEEQLAKEKMECILAVGKGSTRPPRLLLMRYQGNPNSKQLLAFVGKGITFDSGGLSIKTGDGMMTMKCDMAGAATVSAATIACARLRIPINILCVAPLAENMPGGKSLKPGDVLRAKNGKTIEVLNTDAEGRLVLSDALSHAVDLGATHIVDLATLTGACMVALGPTVAGVMTNNEPLSERVLSAAKAAGERAWPLPMFDDYDEQIKSGIADMKNIGTRYGGAITAAKLLAHFVGDVPWVHVDIAGPAFAEKEPSHQDAGGTGFFVRSLVTLAEDMAKRPE